MVPNQSTELYANLTRDYPYFHNINGEEADNLLQNEPNGTYLIRPASAFPHLTLLFVHENILKKRQISVEISGKDQTLSFSFKNGKQHSQLSELLPDNPAPLLFPFKIEDFSRVNQHTYSDEDTSSVSSGASSLKEYHNTQMDDSKEDHYSLSPTGLPDPSDDIYDRTPVNVHNEEGHLYDFTPSVGSHSPTLSASKVELRHTNSTNSVCSQDKPDTNEKSKIKNEGEKSKDKSPKEEKQKEKEIKRKEKKEKKEKEKEEKKEQKKEQD